MSELEQQPATQTTEGSAIREANSKGVIDSADSDAASNISAGASLDSSALVRADFNLEDRLDESLEYRYGFRVGPLKLLHDGSTVVELVDSQTPTPLPNVPLFLKGVVSVRGNLIPLYDLKLLLSGDFAARLHETNTQKPYYAVFGAGQRSAMLIIDQLPAQIRFTKDLIVEDSETSLLPEFMWPLQQAVVDIEGERWSQIDFDGLFVALGLRVANG